MNKKLKTQTQTKGKCYLKPVLDSDKFDDRFAFYRLKVEGYSFFSTQRKCSFQKSCLVRNNCKIQFMAQTSADQTAGLNVNVS